MALNFTTTKEQAQLHGVKILVHSRAGMGKTTLIKTLPDPIIISAEAGLLSLGSEEIPTLLIKNFSELDEAYQFIAYSPHAKRFRSVALDSITELAETCLTAEKAKSKDPRRAYGEMQDEVLKRIRWFRDLPGKHVYFSSKMTGVKDEITGLTLYGPKMPGQQLGPQLPYLFDEVLNLDIGRTPEGREFRFLRTKTDLQYDCKDRSGKLDPWEPPDLGHIINKITGGQ
jgi:hypothetical protein